MKNIVWLSSYIYYKDDADTLLRESVAPVVQTVLQKKWAQHYFFIRYSDSKGPHIRLRFQGDEDKLEKYVKPYLQKHFKKTRFVRYAPEFKRYGGKNGVAISEKLFESSSKAILGYIAESNETSYQRTLGMTLQLNLAMMHDFGMDRKEAHDFFDHIGSQDKEQYEKHLALQSDAVVPFLKNLWDALEQQVPIETSWFTNWQKETSEIAQELQTAFKEKQLQYVDPYKKHVHNPLWYIYESYIHMNNNRLGIVRADEGFAAYIIAKGLNNE